MRLVQRNTFAQRMTEDNLDRGVSRATYELNPGEMRCMRCELLCAEAEADDNGWCPLCQEEAVTGRMLGPSEFEAMCEVLGDRR